VAFTALGFQGYKAFYQHCVAFRVISICPRIVGFRDVKIYIMIPIIFRLDATGFLPVALVL
jgi:hypothetical protein